MRKTLYLECYSGISGDMMVGALLDLGADPEILKEQLKSLPVEGFEVQINRVKKSGLDACDFGVILDEEHDNHDHDVRYLYGHNHGHEHSHGHEHEHNTLPAILEMIDDSGISGRAKKTAAAIFRILADAEAQAHGTTPENVHFHEVGAVDSIVDIAAAAICLDNLNITEVIVPELYEGCGTVRCQHGVIPVPVPAVANIAKEHGLSLHMTGVEAELVTPTGAAIAAAVRTSDRLPDRYKIIKIGMGAGKRDYKRTSILRAMLIEQETQEADYIYKLESNIDDCTGEALGHVMEQLFEQGARDVYYTPIYMKKNRPAYQLNVICTKENIEGMERVIFRETTTIGIRRVRMQRTVQRRRTHTIDTSFGEAEVKTCEFEDGKRVYPEYESVALICRERGLPYQQVWNQIYQEANTQERQE